MHLYRCKDEVKGEGNMRKILVLVLAFLVALSIVGCSAPTDTTVQEDESNAQTEETKEETTEAMMQEDEKDEEVEPLEEPKEEVTPEPVAELPLGETIVVDDVAEITVESTDFKNEIVVGNTTCFADKNETDTFLMITLNYKNLDSESLDSFIKKDIPGVNFKDLVYDGKYNYPSDHCMLGDIAPLSTGTIVFFYVVPQTVADSTESLVATAKIGDTEYNLTIR